ncbi:hypothetical protein ABL78_5175 [Leptomonas seymouri]|uniref:Leucine-rich repeat protein n=1 Tax=Leptomonas seymouri TaxID=5684 RepID=A0A0N0P5A0_LEPSE|nr:hypothetical protein ABL78_5175 [Leptomonas seymouri]|eukprot:KPI85757.1 hypothetical protein ABL78_5175 [Leptomonas seymouri]
MCYARCGAVKKRMLSLYPLFNSHQLPPSLPIELFFFFLFRSLHNSSVCAKEVMTPEVLLQHILLRCETERSNPAASEIKEAHCQSPKETYFAKDESRDFFLALWTEQLAHRTTLDASLHNVLLFLLPSLWSGGPCDTYYLKEVEVGSSETDDLQYIARHCDAQTLFTPGAAVETPLFSILRQLVALLQPKLPQLAISLDEWMVSLDHILLSLRACFLTLHSAFLNSFFEVDKQLIESHGNIPWKDVRQIYCASVCGLCHLLDTQLVTTVACIIATQLNGACGCMKTRLFKNSASRSSEAVSDAVATLFAKRLDSVAAYVATTVRFGTIYSREAQGIRLSRVVMGTAVNNVRRSCCSYVAKLEAVTADEKELSYGGKSPADMRLSIKTDTVNRKPALGTQATSIEPVPTDQVYSLVALPESDNLASRVEAIAPLEDDTLLMVERLLASQQREEKHQKGIYNTSVAQTLTPGCESSSSKPSDGEKALPVVSAATAAALSSPEVPVSPLKSRSSAKETEAFWARLQRTLHVEDSTIQRIKERCKFENESPYPGVFLIDLDVRNNDRATVSFVENLQQLLPSGGSTEMSAKNTRLFKEACTAYAEVLQSKSKELQSVLPFLPTRTHGVLLGSLFAVLRADKQFQSLKEIYQHACHFPTGPSRKISDQALLSNIEMLIIKRIRFFSKSVSIADSSTQLPSRGATDIATEPRRRRVQCAASEDRSHRTSAPTFGKTEQSHRALMQYARRHSGSSAPVSPPPSCTKRIQRKSSIAKAFSEARRNVPHIEMPIPPSETRIEEVYRLACHFYGLTGNSALTRLLMEAKENFLTTLDLSNIYVGVKGLKPVLALLNFNDNHLISLSLCNNNLESEDVAEIGRTLEGPVGENLVCLDLSFNPITCSAFSTLQKLGKQLPRLESLLLKATLLPPDTEEELHRIVASKAAQRRF